MCSGTARVEPVPCVACSTASSSAMLMVLSMSFPLWWLMLYALRPPCAGLDGAGWVAAAGRPCVWGIDRPADPQGGGGGQRKFDPAEGCQWALWKESWTAT
jgi:hypothetical protein